MGVIWNPQSELLRELNLLIPHKKPVGSVKIDWTNPLAEGLTAFTLCEGINPYIYGINEVATHGGSLVTAGADIRGKYFTCPSTTGNYINIGPSNRLFPNNDETTIVYFRKRNSLTDTTTSSFGYVRANNNRVQVHLTYNNTVYWDFGTTIDGRTSVAHAASLDYEKWIFIAGQSKGREIWLDGVRIKSDTKFFTRIANDDDFYVLESSISSQGPADERVYIFGIFSSEWTDEKIASFYADPYQFMIPA